MGYADNRRIRYDQIVDQLRLYGFVSAAEMSAQLGVTPVTVRKDFAALEKNQTLQLVPGGAVPGPRMKVHSEAQRYGSNLNLTLKHRVAAAAAPLIEDGDSLVVTSGATPHLCLDYAKERRNLTIVTDSLIIAEEMCKVPDYRVIILGGEIYTRSSFVHGRDAISQVSRIMADKAILTMDGVDPEYGLSTLRVEGADTLKVILQRARRRILLADSTKIGVESFCHVADLSVTDVLVTNRTDDPVKMKKLEQIRAMGIEVVIAP